MTNDNTEDLEKKSCSHCGSQMEKKGFWQFQKDNKNFERFLPTAMGVNHDLWHEAPEGASWVCFQDWSNHHLQYRDLTMANSRLSRVMRISS
tara:strand:+ start:26 stop:301 length:276 start_codon:yes stop_codon:yes gene_type:complete